MIYLKRFNEGLDEDGYEIISTDDEYFEFPYGSIKDLPKRDLDIIESHLKKSESKIEWEIFNSYFLSDQSVDVKSIHIKSDFRDGGFWTFFNIYYSEDYYYLIEELMYVDDEEATTVWYKADEIVGLVKLLKEKYNI